MARNSIFFIDEISFYFRLTLPIRKLLVLQESIKFNIINENKIDNIITLFDIISRLTLYICGLKINKSHITVIYFNKALLILSVFSKDYFVRIGSVYGCKFSLFIQHLKNVFGKAVFNLPVSGHRLCYFSHRVLIPIMLPTMAYQNASNFFYLSDEVYSFHATRNSPTR